MTQKPARRESQHDRIAERRAQILQAAYDVFAERGYRDTTVADIAQRLGIGHGTFYRYFENKHEVFEHVLMAGLGRVAKVITTDASSIDTLEEYRAKVLRMGQDMLALLESDPALPRLLFYEAMGISPELDEKIQRMWEMAGTITAAYLQNGKTKGFLRADLDVQVTALALNAIYFEAGRRVVRAQNREEMRARWLDATARLMFDGFSAR
jgi:AcrR family transcriptional regulator